MFGSVKKEREGERGRGKIHERGAGAVGSTAEVSRNGSCPAGSFGSGTESRGARGFDALGPGGGVVTGGSGSITGNLMGRDKDGGRLEVEEWCRGMETAVGCGVK